MVCRLIGSLSLSRARGRKCRPGSRCRARNRRASRAPHRNQRPCEVAAARAPRARPSAPAGRPTARATRAKNSLRLRVRVAVRHRRRKLLGNSKHGLERRGDNGLRHEARRGGQVALTLRAPGGGRSRSSRVGGGYGGGQLRKLHGHGVVYRGPREAILESRAGGAKAGRTSRHRRVSRITRLGYRS